MNYLPLLLAKGLAHEPAEPPEGADQAAPATGYRILKGAAEKKFTLGLAYAADLPDQGLAKDGHQDFASASAVEEAAWSFLEKGGEIGLNHEAGNVGRGRVVESYVYRGPDWPQAGGFTVKSGDWLLGVRWDDAAWSAIKAGKVRGYSLQGKATRRRPSPAAVAALRR